MKTSAHNEYVPEALLFPRVATADLISAFSGGDVSITMSISAGWMSASLKCSVHHLSCSSSLVSSLPFLSMTAVDLVVGISTNLLCYFVHSAHLLPGSDCFSSFCNFL